MIASATDTAPTRLLRGRIQNLRRTRCSRDFVFSSADRAKMGATAIAAGLAGLGGIATGLSSMAIDTTEEADFLEFDLDETPIRAWVWQSVFEEGDEVEVVAERLGDLWQGYGIYRVHDQIVALHPHCSRGRYAHYRSALRLTVKAFGFLYAAMWGIGIFMMFARRDDDYSSFFLFMLMGGAATLTIYGLIGYRISRKFMGFVRMAEGIFEAFGWRDVKNIDLPAITKKGKKAGDPAALGVLYFSFPDGRREVRKSPEIDRTSSE
ncbi:putative type VI secretion system effector [Burkholderia territorii]|uniref:putative type VI secretion system effector n=1 Tax=Burkholderia territorii TaxID=1503055 RepID=UPI0009BDDEF0|nr:putative type VI secretion system effector [Burkholderia territorii]